VNTYGFDKFIARCDELAAAYGKRFECPEIVKKHAKSGKLML